jgi:hypothetical protein
MVQLQQGFAAGEMGFDLHFPWQQCLGPFIAMSALPPKADIAECDRDVRFVPIADMPLLRLDVDLLLNNNW